MEFCGVTVGTTEGKGDVVIASFDWKVCWPSLGALFVLSVVVRVAFFVCYTCHEDHAYLAFDSAQYTKVAHNIATGNGIVQESGVPNFYRLPGYPLFLAASYRLFGDDDYSALFIQIILASLIPVLIFILSLILFPGYVRCAQYAGFIAAVHFGLVYYSGLVATEALFLLFLLAFFICFFYVVIWNNGKFRMLWESRILFVAGFMLGCASLLRAVGHYLVVLCLVYILFSVVPIKSKLWSGVLLLLGWLSVVGWWLARNWLLTGYIFFHTLPGLHFLQYSAVHAYMGYVNFGDDAYFATKKKLLGQWEALVEAKEITEHRVLNEPERYALAERLAFFCLVKSPLITIKNSIVNIIRTVGTLYSSLLLYVAPGTVYERGMSLWFKVKLYLTPCVHDPWLRFVIYWDMILFFFLLFGTMLFFCFALHNPIAWNVALTILPFMSLFLVITLAYGCARLRLPIEPLLIISSAWILDRIVNRTTGV